MRRTISGNDGVNIFLAQTVQQIGIARLYITISYDDGLLDGTRSEVSQYTVHRCAAGGFSLQYSLTDRGLRHLIAEGP